ncbi:MAG: SgcJ/EcaC family oxidoreductase [Candidatus Aminicenantes bacterium]|nr:MAG: SgcJ/EcaC family oxidoreductase [Candidatus Aminicenantes bacterium]
MRKFVLIIPLVILICFTFSCQQGEEVTEKARPVVDVEADISAIKEMLNQYAVALNTGDFDLWISLWADDGVQMPPDAPAVIGKEQIRDAMKPAFDQMTVDIAITSIEDVKVYGDLGLTHCKYTLDMTPKAGGETIHAMRDGKALTLLERQSDGSWKIVYDCFNSNVPPTSEKE